MPEALLLKVKAHELETIARGLVNVAVHQGFTVNITMDYDITTDAFNSTITVKPKPIKQGAT